MNRFACLMSLTFARAPLVLAATAVLSMTSPHRAGAQDHHHAAPEDGVTVATEAAGLSVTLQARPARAGPNRIDLWLARPDGAAFAAKEVWLEMSRPGAGIAGLRRPMREAAPGRFVLDTGAGRSVSSTRSPLCRPTPTARVRDLRVRCASIGASF